MKTLILLLMLLSSFGWAEAKKAVLVVSFGTSYKEAETRGIKPVEKAISTALKERRFYRAFTSSFIRKKILKRDGIKVYSPREALEAIKADGIKDVVIQTLHIIPGAEYQEVLDVVEKYRKDFDRIVTGKPLLYSDRDYKETAEAVASIFRKGETVVLMGHGTHHKANSCYHKFHKVAAEMGLPLLMGTVEGTPALNDVIADLKRLKVKSFRLAPFMLVAGDHAVNDMAGDEEDSWKTILIGKGYKPELFTHGLGENSAIRAIFIRHALEAEKSGQVIPKERIKKGKEITYADPEGKVWEIPYKPERVVFCHNSLMEIWYMAGGKASGRVKSNVPMRKEEKSVPVVGLLGNPVVEKIVATRPDLVVLSGNFRKHERVASLLRSAGIRCLLIKYTTYNDFLEILDLFARVNGTEKSTGMLISNISSSVEGIVNLLPLKKPSVLLLFATPKNITCELPAGSTGFCVEMLGGRNIAKGAPVKGGRRVMYSMERIMADNPDVILVKTMGDMDVCENKLEKEFRMHPGWSSLKAVKQNRLHFLPKEYFMYKPNRLYPVAFRYLFRLLYPQGKSV